MALSWFSPTDQYPLKYTNRSAVANSILPEGNPAKMLGFRHVWPHQTSGSDGGLPATVNWKRPTGK